MAALILSSCASLPEGLLAAPDISLRNVNVMGLGIDGQTFLLTFDASNPNAIALPVKYIAYGLELDGKHFASGKTASEFTIPANGTASFAISVDLNLLRTAPELLFVVRDGTRRDIPYAVKGELGVDIPMTPVLRYRNSGGIRLGTGSY
tara:strand:+ start:4844 stop:5290 length:447 start_codon:yes stop_codon:yes gene_type:complete